MKHMTDNQSGSTRSEHLPRAYQQPLPVTITPGMRVVDASDMDTGTILGITQAYCVYRTSDDCDLQVAAWRDMAVANICPAHPLLSDQVAENDRRNASATVLRELLALERLGPLRKEQQTVRDELMAFLCS
jgi:hypothetical protein